MPSLSAAAVDSPNRFRNVWVTARNISPATLASMKFHAWISRREPVHTHDIFDEWTFETL